MTDLDHLIAESLQRRAGTLPAAPKSYLDVTRRITRRRRRVRSMTTAAVALPGLGAVGWAVTRPEPAATVSGDAPAGSTTGGTGGIDTSAPPTGTIVDISDLGPVSTVLPPGPYPLDVTGSAVPSSTEDACAPGTSVAPSETTTVIAGSPVDTVMPPAGSALEVTASTTAC
jgi:hypothetical protein